MSSFHILWHDFLFVFQNSTTKVTALLGVNATKRGIQLCIL